MVDNDKKTATLKTSTVSASRRIMADKQKSTDGTEKAKTEAVKKTESAEKGTTETQNKTKSTEKKVKVSPKLEKIIQEIEKLSVLELADLVKALEEKFGVTAAVPVAAAAPATVQGATPAAEEKSEFDVILSAIGGNKIAAIKAVREIKTDIGLKEAKELVESAPKEVLKAADKKTAEEAKKKLETAGCQVELK